MHLTRRHIQDTSDLLRIAEFIYAYPSMSRHVIDQPYRLTSYSMERPQNVVLWEDEQGRLMAYAFMQEPFLTLDYLIHPKAISLELEEEILAWGVIRARQVATEQGRTFPFYVSEFPEIDDIRLALLARHGLKRETWADSVFLRQLLVEPVPPPTLTEGFSIRHLYGENEVEAYVALHRAAFGSGHMQAQWRQRSLQMPQYVPELDLVAVTPDGRLAAFCVIWLHPDGHTGRVEPMGVHPDFRRLGLGQALLHEGFGRLHSRGATAVEVETGASNTAARRLYESVGFQVAIEWAGYGRLFYPAG